MLEDVFCLTCLQYTTHAVNCVEQIYKNSNNIRHTEAHVQEIGSKRKASKRKRRPDDDDDDDNDTSAYARLYFIPNLHKCNGCGQSVFHRANCVYQNNSNLVYETTGEITNKERKYPPILYDKPLNEGKVERNNREIFLSIVKEGLKGTYLKITITPTNIKVEFYKNTRVEKMRMLLTLIFDRLEQCFPKINWRCDSSTIPNYINYDSFQFHSCKISESLMIPDLPLKKFKTLRVF